MNTLQDTIRLAATAADFQGVAGLVADYVAWCRDRYREHPWFVDRVFGHQSLDAELETLAEAYSPPSGKALVAVRDGEVGGLVCYRQRGDGICEMKRLFVASRLAGHRTGRRLCEALIAMARDDGFRLMRLDTGHLMVEAIALYQSLGFRRCEPYHDYPVELAPFIVFMELRLNESARPDVSLAPT